MQQNRDDYEPIIADRRSRQPLREETQPLWRLVLALSVGVAVVIGLALWWMGRPSREDAATTAQSESSTPEFETEVLQEDHVEQVPAPAARDFETDSEISRPPAPPAHDPETDTDIPPAPALQAPEAEPSADAEQAATSENIPPVAPDDTVQAPVSSAPSAPVSVRFMSPDAQVRFELRGPPDSSAAVTSRAGDVVAVAPGAYRVVASGPDLETFEQEVTFDGDRPYEYTVELCAQREPVRESLAGRVVEERACASTQECESMFMILSEHADQLVKDRAFRTQQCAKWRADAAPEGRWTLDTKCDGATLATTCRIEIAEAACTLAEAPRSLRGTACPRAELN